MLTEDKKLIIACEDGSARIYGLENGITLEKMLPKQQGIFECHNKTWYSKGTVSSIEQVQTEHSVCRIQ